MLEGGVGLWYLALTSGARGSLAVAMGMDCISNWRSEFMRRVVLWARDRSRLTRCGMGAVYASERSNSNMRKEVVFDCLKKRRGLTIACMGISNLCSPVTPPCLLTPIQYPRGQNANRRGRTVAPGLHSRAVRVVVERDVITSRLRFAQESGTG